MTKKISYYKILQYYWRQTKVAKRHTIIIAIFRILSLGEILLEPILIRYLIDAIQTWWDVWKWVYYLIGISILNFVSRRIIEFTLPNAQLKPMRTIMATGFTYIHKHSSRFFAENMSWSLLRKLKDWMFVYENLYDIIIFSLITPIWISCGAVYFLRIEDWKLWLGLLLRILTFVTLQIILYKYKWPYEEASSKALSELSGYLADSFSNHSTIENSGSLWYEETILETKLENRYTKTKQNRGIWNRIYALSWFLMNFMRILAVVGSLTLLEQWSISIAVVVMTILFINSICNQLRDIWNTFKRVLKSLEDWREYLKLIYEKHELKNYPLNITKDFSRWDICFDRISFGYWSASKRNSWYVLNDFSLHIMEWEHIGLVWPSWAWKSTLSKLLLRLYDPQSWKITIWWKNINSFTLEWLRSQISFVPQDPNLFHRSLRENIMYWKPQASDQELYEATRRAQIHDFISNLPEWYESLVWERWVKLSGWQRQRVAIARAILQNAPIIILDEATSSLDSVTESAVQQAMIEVMKGKTAIVIAHRLWTVRHLDRLIVLQEWTIVEQWTHDELIQIVWVYSSMTKLQ